MSPRGQILYKTGSYGSTVKVIRRDRGTLALLFRRRGEENPTTVALGHNDLREAKDQARRMALALAQARMVQGKGPLSKDRYTVGQLLARYQRIVSDAKKGEQPKEDKRRRRLWVRYLGPRRLARTVGPDDVRLFIRARREGTIRVPNMTLLRTPKPRTIDADVVYLQSVYNWAYNEARLLSENPLRGSKRPEVSEQMRPMATPDRAAKLLEHAPAVHRRYPLLLTMVRWLGWRISALCAIRVQDIDRTAVPEFAPYGQIRKDWRHDKEGQSRWVPMPKPVREAIDALGLIGAGWVFPAERAKGKGWSRSYARDLLERCEGLAGLTALEGGDYHPYRRLWATERKNFPLGDVGNAGDWKDRRSVERYTLNDPRTTSAVMLFDPTSAQPGTQPGTQKPKKSATKGGRRAASQ